MKKLVSLILAVAAFSFATVSCVQEQLATFDDSLATAPVILGQDLTEDGLVVTFTPGALNQKFNQSMPVNHSLVLLKANDKEVVKVLASAVSGDSASGYTITASNNTLSRALISLGFAEGDIVSMELSLRASLQDQARDNGRNGYVESVGRVNVPGFEVTIPKGSPYMGFEEASSWSVIGKLSKYDIDWNGDLNMWTNGKTHVAAHVNIAADDEFKFRKDQDWAVNMGGEFSEIDSQFAVAQDGANIKVGKDGVYDLFFDESTGKAWVSEAYDPFPDYSESSSWGVIGKLTKYSIDWNGDIPMITDGKSHLALGVALAADDEFKFRKDQDWAVNMGGEFGSLDAEFAVTQDGANIKVGAEGVYDLFVNPDAGTAMVATASGAKVSAPIVSAEPEPEGPSAWSLIGTIGGSSWDSDIDMTNVEGGKWIARLVTLTADDEFKIRADHDWAISYGGPEANSKSTIDPANPYDVYKPVIGTAFDAGDKNIQVGVAGVFDITLNYSAEGSTILIEEHKASYSLIGEINGDSWSKDVIMTESDGIWTSPVVNITGGFKIRYDFSWDNCYGAESKEFVATPGTPFTAVQPGENIQLAEAGDYKVVFNPATLEVTINAVAFPEQLFMIGAEFGGWDWNSDGVVEMTPVVYQPDWGADSDKSEAQFFAIRYISAGQGFKFCSKREWNGDFWGLTTNEGFTEAGGNCTVSEDGIYLIHVDLKREIVHVEPARVYGIGNCFGGWDSAMADALFTPDGKTLKAKAKADGELRMYVESAIANSGWWTREFIIIDGKIDYRGDDEGQGDQARVNVKNGQEIVLDFNAGTGEIRGEGEASEIPTTMFMIGEQFGNWDWASDGVVELVPVWGTQGIFWCTRWFDHSKGFKFCSKKEWNGDFTGAGGAGYSVDAGNCWVAEDGIYTVYVNADGNIVEVAPAEVYGLGDVVFAGGGWDYDSAVKFTPEGDKMTITTTGDGELRIASKVQPTAIVDGCTPNGWFDWWKTEFIFFSDGKIIYRGLGNDQERVQAKAGQKIILDFNAGTATLEGGN